MFVVMTVTAILSFG